MNNPGIINSRNTQESEKEKWGHGSKETLLEVREVKARICKLKVNYRFKSLGEKDKMFTGYIYKKPKK